MTVIENIKRDLNASVNSLKTPSVTSSVSWGLICGAGVMAHTQRLYNDPRKSFGRGFLAFFLVSNVSMALFSYQLSKRQAALENAYKDQFPARKPPPPPPATK